MKYKKISVLAVLTFSALFGFLGIEKLNFDGGEASECSKSTVKVMGTILIGQDIQGALSLFEQQKLPYAIWKEGIYIPVSRQVSGPFEVIVTAKETGIIVGRREKLVLDVGRSYEVMNKHCQVVLTGP